MTKQPKTVFIPARPDELQIDLDRPRARIPKRLLRLVSEHVKIKSVHYSRSKSGNTHVIIRLKPLQWNYANPSDPQSIYERLFLQAVLGSDPVRELLSWGRARNGCPYPTIFFEKSPAASFGSSAGTGEAKIHGQGKRHNTKTPA